MPPASSSHQTLSFLKRRFAEVGIRPKTKHGQNFLIDMNLLGLLLNAAELEPRDVVLEVGTGTGGLTALLAERAGAVVTVEIDPQLRQLASEHLIDVPNVRLLGDDALKNKNTIHPRVLEQVETELAAAPDRRLKLASNLPYNIATPILSNLLTTSITPVTMTVTIQKELADRIMARPSTKDYSALSIWMQSQATIELVRLLPPEAFWPRPKVTSAIIHVTIRDDLRGRIHDRPFFHQFVRLIFQHRRKLLRGVLASAYKRDLSKPEVDDLMAGLEIGADRRAEQLDVETMIALAEAVRTRLGNVG